MPLAGYPAEDLFPADDLYPGIPTFRLTFRTPEQNMASRMEGHLYALLPHSLSVWRIGAVWSEGFAPGPAVVAAASRFYQGGYEHEIDSTEFAELTAAGYADRITLLEVDD